MIKMKNDQQKSYNQALIFAIFLSAITFFISIFTKEIFKSTLNLTMFVRVICYIYVLYGLLRNIKRFNKNYRGAVLFILVFFVLFCVSLLNQNTNAIIMKQNLLLEVFVQGILVFIMVYNINDVDDFVKKLIIGSRAIFLLGVIAFFTTNISKYYMAFGYRMLLPIIVLLYSWRQYNNKIDMILGIVGIIIVFVGGSRGAALIAMISLFGYLILNFKSQKQRIIAVISVILCIIVYVYSSDILSIMNKYTSKYGIYSRTLNKVGTESAYSDTHRNENYKYGMELLTKDSLHFFVGYGIAGERYYYLRDLSYMQDYGYPHNIIVELYLHYGLIGGSISIILLIIGISIVLNKNMSENMRFVSIALLMYNLQLLISSSYLQSELFFALIGWMFVCNKFKKEKKHYENIGK